MAERTNKNQGNETSLCLCLGLGNTKLRRRRRSGPLLMGEASVAEAMKRPSSATEIADFRSEASWLFCGAADGGEVASMYSTKYVFDGAVHTYPYLCTYSVKTEWKIHTSLPEEEKERELLSHVFFKQAPCFSAPQFFPQQASRHLTQHTKATCGCVWSLCNIRWKPRREGGCLFASFRLFALLCSYRFFEDAGMPTNGGYNYPRFFFRVIHRSGDMWRSQGIPQSWSSYYLS